MTTLAQVLLFALLGTWNLMAAEPAVDRTEVIIAPGWDVETLAATIEAEPGQLLAVVRDGKLWLLGWSSAKVADPQQPLQREQASTIASTKAQAAVAAFLRSDVASSESITTRRTSVQMSDGTRASTLERYRSFLITQHAHAVLGPLAPLASWFTPSSGRVTVVLGVATTLPDPSASKEAP
jgi:hypothetical protein